MEVNLSIINFGAQATFRDTHSTRIVAASPVLKLIIFVVIGAGIDVKNYAPGRPLCIISQIPRIVSGGWGIRVPLISPITTIVGHLWLFIFRCITD